MKKFITIIGLLTLFLVFTGCPYDSDFSIDEKPSIPINDSIIGIWKANDIKDDNEQWDFKFLKFNEFEYYIEITVDNEPTEKFRGFISELNGFQIMNLQSVGKLEDRSYNFYRIQFKNDELEIDWISDENLRTSNINSSKDLRNYFEKESERKGFFIEDKIILRRK